MHSVDHFNFVVPDLKLAQTFYGDFGLDVREEGNGLGLYTAGHDHRWGRVGEGGGKKLTYVAFGLYPEDFEGLSARLKQNDVAQLDSPAGFDSNGVWFRDPDGTLIEMQCGRKVIAEREGGAIQPVLATGRPGLPRAVKGAVRAAATPCPYPAVQQRRQPLRCGSTAGCSACGCRTGRGTASPSCTASTGATTT